MNLTRLLFSFRGRINRGKYWLATFIILLIYFALVLAGWLIFLALGPSALIILVALALIPILVSLLAIGVKRLHDRDKSAWWLLLFYLLPAGLEGIGRGLEKAAADTDASLLVVALVVSLVSLAISIWAFVEIGCLRGTVGDNRYGPDPLAGRQ